MTGKSKSDEWQTPENIIVAADNGRLDLVTALLEGGADPNTVDEVGTSALHNAAKGGHWNIARLLLEKNASLRIEDGNRATPLRLAVRAGHKDIVRLFLECDPPTSETQQTETSKLLRIAASFGYTEIVQLLLDYDTPTLGGNGGLTALHLAAEKGHHDVCELLLKHDKTLNRSLWTRIVGPSLEVDSKDCMGNIPFVYAVVNGHGPTVEVFLRSYPELSKTCDRHKQLLFHRVITEGKIEILRIFLNNGTNIEMKDYLGRRALHLAVNAESMGLIAGATEMIQLLLAHGATVDAKDKDGITPEFYTNNPKTRMILRNHASKGDAPPTAPMVSAPPPEYKA
ncbi:ankyrin repeat-containing domain protein [Aspergillus granulosus]|uniref:Ankyrin repeat-containing domain protein n=1 Tax=Aspergillus granulosus TaxID=176169 RepID=A0ABR4I054_9EURO